MKHPVGERIRERHRMAKGQIDETNEMKVEEYSDRNRMSIYTKGEELQDTGLGNHEQRLITYVHNRRKTSNLSISNIHSSLEARGNSIDDTNWLRLSGIQYPGGLAPDITINRGDKSFVSDQRQLQTVLFVQSYKHQQSTRIGSTGPQKNKMETV